MSVRFVFGVAVVGALAPSAHASEPSHGSRVWVAPSMSVGPTAHEANQEDGHYQRREKLWLFGVGFEAGVQWQPSLQTSLAVHFEETSHLQSGQPLVSQGLSLPARLRFLGLGSSQTRFYLAVGLGFATMWDRSQRSDATSDGGALRSAGGLLELGLTLRHALSESVAIEVGVFPKLQATTALNGARDFADSAHQRYTLPLVVSFPLRL